MINLIRYGPTALAVLAVSGAVWWVMDLRADNLRLRAENASLTRSIAALEQQAGQAAAAREVEAARAERWKERAAKLNASIEALFTDEDIPDVELDPRIVAYLAALGLHGEQD